MNLKGRALFTSVWARRLVYSIAIAGWTCFATYRLMLFLNWTHDNMIPLEEFSPTRVCFWLTVLPVLIPGTAIWYLAIRHCNVQLLVKLLMSPVLPFLCVVIAVILPIAMGLAYLYESLIFRSPAG